MKKLNYLLLLMSLLTLGACTDRVEDTITYSVNEPVFMSKAVFRAPIKISPEEKPITKQGKMCFYQDYLYISSPEVGIHIIDNRDPSAPKNIAFIELLGNTDLAIRNGILYADSYVDMVWFDVEIPAQPKEMGRAKDMFPNALPIVQNNFGCDWEKMNEQKETSIIVGWEVKEKTVQTDKSQYIWWGWGRPMMEDVAFSTNGIKSGATIGVNGSMSRLVFYNDYLYSVFNNQLSIFKFNDTKPEKANKEDIYIGGNVETIFSYKDNLFMGSPTGMIIYSVKDPLSPAYQSRISHALGCDPVVVENDIAYVTIHTGNFCGQNENSLIVVDVSDVKNPKEIKSYSMKNPKGLGIDNGTLFVCDDGLKVFNAKDPLKIQDNLMQHFKITDCYDVIPLNKILMVIGEDGIYQYDYNNQNDIKLLSKLSYKINK